jgi:hypothetical protein
MQHNRYEVHRPVHHVEIDQYLDEIKIQLKLFQYNFSLPRNSSSLETFNKRINLSTRNRRATKMAVQAITTAAVHKELSSP